jgi:hypothetical protein
MIKCYTADSTGFAFAIEKCFEGWSLEFGTFLYAQLTTKDAAAPAM